MGFEDCHALLRRARNDTTGKANPGRGLDRICKVHGHCEERSDEAISSNNQLIN